MLSHKGHCLNNTSTATITSKVDDRQCPLLSPCADTSATGNGNNNILDSQDVLTISAEGMNASAIIDGINSVRIDGIRTLFLFKPASSMNSPLGDLSGEDFMKAIDDAYAQVVHWRPNLFKVPSGACGKQFILNLPIFLMLLPLNLTSKLLQ